MNAAVSHALPKSSSVSSGPAINAAPANVTATPICQRLTEDVERGALEGVGQHPGDEEGGRDVCASRPRSLLSPEPGEEFSHQLSAVSYQLFVGRWIPVHVWYRASIGLEMASVLAASTIFADS